MSGFINAELELEILVLILNNCNFFTRNNVIYSLLIMF